MIQDLIAFYEQGHWIARVFTVVVIVVTINLLLRFILFRLHKRIQSSETIWDDALYEAINPPLRLLVWIVGLGIAAELVEADEADSIFQFVDPARRVAVIATLTWFLVRLIRELEAGFIQRSAVAGDRVDSTTIEALGKLLRLSVLITATLVVLQTMGFSISGVLAFGGVGGIAIGFAAKDMLANFFGGLTVYLDRPFAVGDWVRSPDHDVEGTVEKIGWRSTRIRRFNKRPIYVPNSLFTSMVLENPSRMSNRRVNEVVGVRYADFAVLQAVVDDIRAYLKSHEEVDQDQTIIVNFNQFGASSLDIMVYFLTRTTVWVRYHEVKQEILMDIHRIIEKHGAEVAFPTRTLHIAAGEPVQTS